MSPVGTRLPTAQCESEAEMNTSATHRPAQTNASPTEKLEALFNEQKLRNAQRRDTISTLHQFGQSQANEEGGRFARPTNVIGTNPTAQYPMAAPNWAPQAVGVEPPLGIDVNATEPVGEYGEVTASIERLEEASPQSLDASPARGAAGSVDDDHDVEPPPTPTIRRKP